MCTTGLIVVERNWLDVYPYTSWGTSQLPNLEPGQRLQPTKLSLEQVAARALPLFGQACCVHHPCNGILATFDSLCRVCRSPEAA